jgi:hypothetical protein
MSKDLHEQVEPFLRMLIMLLLGAREKLMEEWEGVEPHREQLSQPGSGSSGSKETDIQERNFYLGTKNGIVSRTHIPSGLWYVWRTKERLGFLIKWRNLCKLL